MTLKNMLQEKCGGDLKSKTNEEIYFALLEVVQEMAKGKEKNVGKKKLYYISAEFLIGKLLSNNLINLGIYDEVKEILEEKLVVDKEINFERISNKVKFLLEKEKSYYEVDGSILFLKKLYFSTKFEGYDILKNWFEFLKQSIYINAYTRNIVTYNGESLMYNKYFEKEGTDNINNFLKENGFKYQINYTKSIHKNNVSYFMDEDEEKMLLSLNNNELNERIAMFKNGTAQIYIGAPTKLERREKKMRFIDALCALKSTKNGILPGSGLIYFKISNNLETDSTGAEILKIALTKPIEQILENSGLIPKEILKEIKESNYEKLYNVKNDKYELVSETNVLDTKEILITALKNACSIASMLLTTTSLIINEYQNNLHKINDYNEI